MYIEHKPWDWVSVVKDRNYSLVKADEKTRKKQLEDYKAQAIKSLEQEILEIKSLS